MLASSRSGSVSDRGASTVTSPLANWDLPAQPIRRGGNDRSEPASSSRCFGQRPPYPGGERRQGGVSGSGQMSPTAGCEPLGTAVKRLDISGTPGQAQAMLRELLSRAAS